MLIGVDLSIEQWDTVLRILLEKSHFPFFDMAYQGFSKRGAIEQDAYPIRQFAQTQKPMFLAQSFSKNMGMYGCRIGTFSFSCVNEEEVARMMSEAKLEARQLWSNPPKFGSSIGK